MTYIASYKSITPQIAKTVFIAPTAAVIGDVHIGAESSVWYSAVLRGDVNYIRVGARTNIQDGSVVHVETDGFPTVIGDDVTIGHSCIIHACTVEDRTLIGMQSCILDGAHVESGAILAAGSLLTKGKRVPSGQLWGGRPAKYMRDVTEKEQEFLKISADSYARLAKDYLGS